MGDSQTPTSSKASLDPFDYHNVSRSFATSGAGHNGATTLRGGAPTANSVPTSAAARNGVLLSFGTLQLGEHAPSTLRNQASTSWDTNGGASSSWTGLSAAQNLREEGSSVPAQLHHGFHEHPMIPSSAEGPEYSRFFVNPHSNMWANNYSGDTAASTLHSVPGRFGGSMDYASLSSGYGLEDFAGNLRGKMQHWNPPYGGPSTSNSVHQFRRQSVHNRPENGYNLASRSNGFPSRSRFTLQDSMRNSDDSSYLHFGQYGSRVTELLAEDRDLIVMAQTFPGSQLLQEVLQCDNYMVTDRIFRGVLGSVFGVITDQNGQHVFQKLIETCNLSQLQSILMELTSQKDSFMDAAFNSRGSLSIQRLIKQLKNTPLAFSITNFIAPVLCDLMKHPKGRYVSGQCIKFLGNLPNQVLFEVAIENYKILATDQQGCLSLNQFIDHITGKQREKLLNLVIEHSECLSHDPFGNYVVQHVLKLSDTTINDRICVRLLGNFAELSKKKGGSHVVEKCLTCSSKSGMTCVVEEILNKRAVLKLAENEYGNYVIQTALEKTKNDDPMLYGSILRDLQPHSSQLMRHNFGKGVLKSKAPARKHGRRQY